MNSQLQLLHTQYFHKIKSIYNSTMAREGTTLAPPLPKELLAADGSYQRENNFSFGLGTIRLPIPRYRILFP